MSHTQTVVAVVAGTVLFTLWLWFQLWIGWMLVRVLRWTYLEKKQAHRWSPPPGQLGWQPTP